MKMQRDVFFKKVWRSIKPAVLRSIGSSRFRASVLAWVRVSAPKKISQKQRIDFALGISPPRYFTDDDKYSSPNPNPIPDPNPAPALTTSRTRWPFCSHCGRRSCPRLIRPRLCSTGRFFHLRRRRLQSDILNRGARVLRAGFSSFPLGPS